MNTSPHLSNIWILERISETSYLSLKVTLINQIKLNIKTYFSAAFEKNGGDKWTVDKADVFQF